MVGPAAIGRLLALAFFAVTWTAVSASGELNGILFGATRRPYHRPAKCLTVRTSGCTMLNVTPPATCAADRAVASWGKNTRLSTRCTRISQEVRTQRCAVVSGLLLQDS